MVVMMMAMAMMMMMMVMAVVVVVLSSSSPMLSSSYCIQRARWSSVLPTIKSRHVGLETEVNTYR
eukprot:4948269-Pyramimonas_sp.AAC.1